MAFQYSIGSNLAVAAALCSLSACAAAPSGLFVRHNPNAVTPVSDTELIQVGRAVDRLEADPNLRLVLIGHADATGDATANKELSLQAGALSPGPAL